MWHRVRHIYTLHICRVLTLDGATVIELRARFSLVHIVYITYRLV